MARFHVNQETGEPGRCRAEKKCPFGLPVDAHFDSKKDAARFYEHSQPDQIGRSITRRRDEVGPDRWDVDTFKRMGMDAAKNGRVQSRLVFDPKKTDADKLVSDLTKNGYRARLENDSVVVNWEDPLPVTEEGAGGFPDASVMRFSGDNYEEIVGYGSSVQRLSDRAEATEWPSASGEEKVVEQNGEGVTVDDEMQAKTIQDYLRSKGLSTSWTGNSLSSKTTIPPLRRNRSGALDLDEVGISKLSDKLNVTRLNDLYGDSHKNDRITKDKSRLVKDSSGREFFVLKNPYDEPIQMTDSSGRTLKGKNVFLVSPAYKDDSVLDERPEGEIYMMTPSQVKERFL